jgi:TFIIF-interacting CTD phosphatase-like protein
MNEYFYKHLNKQKEINKDIVNHYNHKGNYERIVGYGWLDNESEIGEIFKKIKFLRLREYENSEDFRLYYVKEVSLKFDGNIIVFSRHETDGYEYYMLKLNDKHEKINKYFGEFIRKKYKETNKDLYYALRLIDYMYY